MARCGGDPRRGCCCKMPGPARSSGGARRSAPDLLWNDLADYIGSFDEREPWDGEFRLLDGRLVSCKISAMPQGSTLVAFSVQVARRDRVVDDAAPMQAVLIA